MVSWLEEGEQSTISHNMGFITKGYLGPQIHVFPPTTVKFIRSISAVVFPVTPEASVNALATAALPLDISAFCRCWGSGN